MRAPVIAVLMLACCVGAAHAQRSAGFILEEHAFTSGGVPGATGAPGSGGVRLSFAAFGSIATTGHGAGGLLPIDPGFVATFRPPGEVAPDCGSGGPCVSFSNPITIAWPPEVSAGLYNLYRGSPGDPFGQCDQPGLTAPVAIARDSPDAGEVVYYLVTAVNRLGEEGTRGFGNAGGVATERRGATCP